MIETSYLVSDRGGNDPLTIYPTNEIERVNFREYYNPNYHLPAYAALYLFAIPPRDGPDRLDMESMSLLIPDRNKQNQEDFIWSLPIERVKWNKWYDLSVKLKTVTPESVRYVKRKEGEKVVTVLIMPNEKQSDDDAMVACAWLRMVQGITCRMYVVRCTDQSGKMNAAQLMNAVVGLDPDTIHEIEDPEEEKPA